MTVNVRDCTKGHVLGDDGICYKKPLAASKRMWPPGRKPLLTGGDLNAIAKASRAATAMKKQQKRLQKWGMLQKPSTRRATAAHVHARPIAAVSVPQ